METYRIEEMNGGWFVGHFSPAAIQTEDFEVCYKIHPKGESWDVHYHKEATEVNLLVRGTMTSQGKTLKAGDIFVVHPYEVSNPVFLEDCEVVVVKTPSVPNDKYVI